MKILNRTGQILIEIEGDTLYEANLRGANLREAYLGEANLYGANLGGAYLGGVTFCGATIDGAILRSTDIGGPGHILCALTKAEWGLIKEGRAK